MEYTAAGLFLTGLILGSSRCVLTCGPVLGLYVAGTGKRWPGGIRATLAFSLARLIAYVALAFLAGVLGLVMRNLLTDGRFAFWVSLLAGSCMSFLGVLIVLGKERGPGPGCGPGSHVADGSLRSMAFLGLTIGLTPCPPLLALLTYIAATAQGPILGALYGLCFGIGPTLITPVVLIGGLASVVPRLLFQTPAIYGLFRRACGLLLVLYGLRFIAQAWRG